MMHLKDPKGYLNISTDMKVALIVTSNQQQESK